MTQHVQAVTFLVPESAAEPMAVEVPHFGLRMVLVNRESIGLLGDDWRRLGVYFLLGPSTDDSDQFQAYVGEVGKSTLVLRMKHHVTTKDWWNRALLITSRSNDFNSAEIGWLEGRLFDVLHNAVACRLRNSNRPGDDSLPPHQRDLLEKYVPPIMAALRACGAAPDTADQRRPPAGRTPKKQVESLAALIAAGLLKPGTVLRPSRKDLAVHATVLQDGTLEVAEQEYDSPSGAAKAASGNVAESGWDFWLAPSGRGGYVPIAELRTLLREGPDIVPPGKRSTPHSQSTSTPTGGTGATKQTASRPTVQGLIAAGLLQPGATLRSVRKAVATKATVGANGEIVVDGVAHATPSGVAKAASGAKAEAGWDFWIVAKTGDSLAQLRSRLAPPSASRSR